ncbi:hypothetical protein OF83DRAFT_1062391, partial [Amylostereum chailletii]
HMAGILAVNLIVYAYRDIWPLLTYTLAPQDGPYDNLLWVKIFILVIASILPLEPVLDPNPEQMASLFSLAIYGFLDPLIFKAYWSKRLPPDELLPLADYDRTKHLVQQGFQVNHNCHG